MDNFLEKHNLRNLTQNEIEKPNGTGAMKDVTAWAENVPLKARGWSTPVLCLSHH